MLKNIGSQIFDLGIHDLENSLTEIEFPKRQGKIRKTYLMGNGNKVDNATEAADLFIRRECPQIANCTDEPHRPVFVPDTFLFNSLKPEVSKYNYLHKAGFTVNGKS